MNKPIAWPMGVVVPYARHISHGFVEDGENRSGINEAMRDPRANPSNVWWKEIATRRTTKDVPVATLTAIPIKML